MATYGFWLGFDFAVCSLSKCVETMCDGCVWVVGWHYGIMFGYEKWNMEVVCVSIVYPRCFATPATMLASGHCFDYVVDGFRDSFDSVVL